MTPCFQWHHRHPNSLTPFFSPILQVLVWPNSCPPFVDRSPGSPERCCFKVAKGKKSINQSVLLWSTLTYGMSSPLLLQNTNSALKLFWSTEGVQFFRRQLSSENVMDNKVWKKQNLTCWLLLLYCSSTGPSAPAKQAVFIRLHEQAQF